VPALSLSGFSPALGVLPAGLPGPDGGIQPVLYAAQEALCPDLHGCHHDFLHVHPCMVTLCVQCAHRRNPPGDRPITDPKLIGGRGSDFSVPEVVDPLVKDGGASKADALTAYMRSGQDLLNMIPDALIVPVEGQVVSSHSGELMEKVALAMDAENAAAEKASPPRDPDTRRALKKAGVNEAVYLQMATHPDFQAVVKRVYTAFVLIPRWAAICRSMSKSAMAGDVAAARWVRDLIDSGDEDMEESMRSIERAGPGALQVQAAEIQLVLTEIMSQSEEAERPEDLVQAARDDVAVQHMRPEPEVKIDLSDWT
jgi:hypothetical protein